MSTAASAKKSLTVRELQAILADCDPEATVNLYIPGFIDASDKQVIEDPDLAGYGYSYVPQIAVHYETSVEAPYEHFFNEDGSVRPGVKPNNVSIELPQETTDSLFRCRKRAIEAAAEDAGMEPEPAVGDAETVIVDVAMLRSLHATIRTLLHAVNTSHQVREEPITLHESDIDRLIASRKRAIEADADSVVEDAGMEPEPVTADADSVVVDVRLSRELHTTIRQLLRGVNASHQVKVEQACTHGLLTVAGALEMLAEDLGMVDTRPGSWEGSNMAQVLASHGYNY